MRVRLLLFAAVLLLAGGAIYVWKGGSPAEGLVEPGKAATSERFANTGTAKHPRQTAALERTASDEKPGGASPARVVVTPVHKSEVPIYLSGIGTVQAYYTVDNASSG